MPQTEGTAKVQYCGREETADSKDCMNAYVI